MKGDTPERLRRARRHLGLNMHEMAAALRMGKNGYQSVSRWEKPGNTVPGPVQVAVELLLEQDNCRKRMATAKEKSNG